MLALIFVSVVFRISDYELSFIYGVLPIILLIANACEKKKSGVIILSYIGISIIDMIFSIVFIIIFHLNVQRIFEEWLLDVGINSFSLIVIIVISLILCKKKANVNIIAAKKYISVYIIGGISLALYLTSIQFICMGESISTYKSGLVAGFSLSSLVLIILCVLLILNSNENENLKRIDAINRDLLEMQKEYYMMLLEKEDETKAFRHDIRKHIFCLNKLYTQKNYDDLGKYLFDLEETVEELSPVIQTGNNLITTVVNDILKKHSTTYINWIGMIPDTLNVSSFDLCTIFYNLLSNAAEAAENSKEKVIDVKVKFMETSMMVIISNSYSGAILQDDENLFSTKLGHEHGYGIKNVKKCIEKIGGTFSINYTFGM